jgi:large subunit ribosomal protein L29
MSNVKDLRELTDSELEARLRESGESLFQMRMQQTLGQLENKARFRVLRREVARIHTVRNERRQHTGEGA